MPTLSIKSEGGRVIFSVDGYDIPNHWVLNRDGVYEIWAGDMADVIASDRRMELARKEWSEEIDHYLEAE